MNLNLKELKTAFVQAKQFYTLAADKQLMHYAASLSYHSVLSLIPLLLISLGLFTKMPSFYVYYEKIKLFIFENLLPTHQETITSYIDQFLGNISALGIVGLIAVAFTSIMFFSDYIFVINVITRANPRGFWRSFSIYWTMMTLMPLALGVSFWLSTLIQAALDSYGYGINFLSIFPYIIIWAIFCITFMITINKEMKFVNVLFASFISSSIWAVSKFIFVQYAFYNKTYTSIYGSFSILLFFFLWLYFSWAIFLYGVKILTLLEDYRTKKLLEKENETGENEAKNGGEI